jgi:stress-induced-phosphoprotein 1
LRLPTPGREDGNKHFKGGMMENAIAAYTKAIEALPDPMHILGATFYSNRAACYKNLYDNKNVVADCTRALEIDPGTWKVRWRFHIGCGRFDWDLPICCAFLF